MQKKYSLRLLTILLICTMAGTIQAQLTVSGSVTDSSGEPIPGVSVVIKKTTWGTVTDMEGRFSIRVPDSTSTLVFSFVGFKTKEVKLKGRQKIEVKMQEELIMLDEVIVTGYGVMKKSDMTGSVVTIRGLSSTGSSPSYRSGSRSLEGRVAGIHSPGEENPTRLTYPGENGKAGTLTAGEIHDFSKWKMWEDITANDLKEYQEYWNFRPIDRYTLQLTDTEGFPLIDASVALVNEKNKPLWMGHTDNTGKAELWDEMFADGQHASAAKILVNYRGQSYNLDHIKPFHKGINSLELSVETRIPEKVDIAFMVDATGSMMDEINFLKVELDDVMQHISDSLPDLSLRLGAVFYRDAGDEYITRKSDLSTEHDLAISFIRSQNANGGGDEPEAVDSALSVAITGLDWSREARARILFLVLDAPPHEGDEVSGKIRSLTELAAAKGIRIVPVSCSGIGKTTEYLMRSIALATNGTYVFLTDDSGVGNPHIKPTTDTWKVEKLNSLLSRLIYQYTSVVGRKEVQQWQALAADTLEPVPAPDSSFRMKSKVEADSLQPDDEPLNLIGDDIENLDKTWKLYPNPTPGIINIDPPGRKGELYITDLTGKILERIEWTDHLRITVDLGKYPSGIYFARFSMKGVLAGSGKIMLAR